MTRFTCEKVGQPTRPPIPSHARRLLCSRRPPSLATHFLPMELLHAHPLSLAAAAAALLLGLYFLMLSRASKKRYAPLVGTVFHQLFHFSTVHDYHADLARRFKCFRLLGPGRSYVYLADPADVEYILRTNFPNYGKGSYNYNNIKDLLGDGIFAVDGDKWRHQRKLASFEFSTRNLRDYSSNIFRCNAVRLAHVISEAASSNRTVDIQDLFMKSTLDSIFKVGFGVELDTLSGSNEEGTRFAKAFDDSSELILWRYADVFWKIKKALNIGSEAALRKHMKVIDAFVYKVINKKIEQLSGRQDDSVKKEDILSRFLVGAEKDNDAMTNKYLRDIILNFIVAGRDTTAGTLSWFFYMLCKHPGVQEKVAREVKEATKSVYGISMAEFASKLTEEALANMQYTHAALTETLRLYPAVPEDPKMCLSDDILPNGFHVKEGDMVCYLPYCMGRLKDLWGEDVDDFRPERWLNENGIFQPESPFKFTAFQAGPRICLGKEFAYRQMKILAAVLLHFFAFRMGDEAKNVHYRSMMTLQVDQGLHLRASPRQAKC